MINVDGSPRKVVMQANRSGFLYALDAKDGKLIAANAYDKVNWADGVDRETGASPHDRGLQRCR
jgi:glucose dehydrogenase